MIHEAVDTAETLLVAVLLWAGAAGGSVVFVLAVVVGTVVLQPPWAQHGAWRGSGAPHSPSGGFSDAGDALRASEGPSKPPGYREAA